MPLSVDFAIFLSFDARIVNYFYLLDNFATYLFVVGHKGIPSRLQQSPFIYYLFPLLTYVTPIV